MSPSTQALIEQLTPVAKSFGSTVAADDLRYRGRIQYGIVLDSVKPSVVSVAITAALKAAGYRPTNETVLSRESVARGRRVLVWER